MLHKTGWIVITALFLMIAWATSDDDIASLPPLPVSAYLDGKEIMIVNEGPHDYDSLTLVLNGIYSVNPFSLPAGEINGLPVSSFETKSGDGFPESEAPDFLEVYYNGDSTQMNGGYAQIKLD